MSQLPQSRDATALNAPTIKRHPFRGVVNTIRFNWDYYIVASGGLGGGLVLACVPLPDWMRWLGVSGMAVAGYFLLASLIASLWVYDLAPLYRWEWLPRFIGMQPRYALNLHSGFDETSLTLQRLFPMTAWWAADFFDPSQHMEASISRARRVCPAPVPFTKVTSTHLPYDTHAFDTIFLLFAAHEIRGAQEREQLFQELRRVLRPGGTVVLVEHLRDLANLAVYGPGALHFHPKQEWERLARQAGFCLTAIVHQTPFVAAFKLDA